MGTGANGSRRIEDYAFLSNMSSAALVSVDGSIDWLCCPRFDSAASFCALLHDASAGRWCIRPKGSYESTRRYVDDSLVLETRFVTDTGVVVLTDCLALTEIGDGGAHAPIEHQTLLRRVTGTSGTALIEMDYRPRFDYGSIVPWFRRRHEVIEAVGGPDALDLVANVHLDFADGAVVHDFEVAEGDEVVFMLVHHASHLEPDIPPPDAAGELIDETVSAWNGWAGGCRHSGSRRDAVVRSLVTLKGLTYAPTGGLVAAPTTSLPEQVGGDRNWDYRFCWLRDATFTLDALLDYGYTNAAIEWRDWLLRAVAGDPEDMQIMYGVRGERRLLEYELPLKGYEDSCPVRVGNAAHEQFQLDVYGEVMDSFHSARRAGIDTPNHAWALEQTIVDHVCTRWSEPDEGIWEVRSGRKHFVHSKVMAWVALDRGIKAIETYGEKGPVDRWRATRDEIRADVMRQGVDSGLGRFKRSYDSSELDASLLMLPLVGFVDAGHEVMRNTIEAIERELMIDGFVCRYRTDAVDDGLSSGEGAFVMCSFWLVDCLLLLGRKGDAEKLLERLQSTANDLGLLSEQYDPVLRRQLGNFPQAFSHVAFVTTVAALESAESRVLARGAL
jgi:GH15 family glucan-1,4-alpha-glucosidase